MKSGIYTTEFWAMAITNIVMVVVPFLVRQGALSQDEANVYLELAKILSPVVSAVVIAFVTGRYISSRAEVKAANGYSHAIEPVPAPEGD